MGSSQRDFLGETTLARCDEIGRSWQQGIRRGHPGSVAPTRHVVVCVWTMFYRTVVNPCSGKIGLQMTEPFNTPQTCDQSCGAQLEFIEQPSGVNCSVFEMTTDLTRKSCFQAVGDAIPIGILQTDMAGTPIFRNATWRLLTCSPREETSSGHWTEIIHSEDRAAVVEKWQNALEHRASWTTVCRFLPRGEQVRWVRLRVNPVLTEFGEGYIATAEDVTASRKAEKIMGNYAARLEFAKEAHQRNAEYLFKTVKDLELANQRGEAAVQAKSEFLANMSHEIRTPMTAILGYTDVLIEENSGRRRNLDMLDVMKRNSEFLLKIINDILDLSKIEAGKMSTEQIECSPMAVVTDVVSLMQVRADGKGLSLIVEFTGALPEAVTTDPTRLRQILINLVGNAIKFTDSGSVRIKTRFVSGSQASNSVDLLEFQIIDTGVGMTDAAASKLFEAFSQADASVTRQFGGTGLGLSISKRLARILGGDITATSVPGSGSTFTVTIAAPLLPGCKMVTDPRLSVQNGHGIRRKERSPSDLNETPLAGLRILVAEDGPDNQRLLSFLLKKAGGTAIMAENGRIACDAVRDAHERDESFDVILMDMQMPVLDGYRATRELRQQGVATPIIALTAHAMEEDRQKCLDAGCDDYATKPIDRPTLYATIIQHVTGTI